MIIIIIHFVCTCLFLFYVYKTNKDRKKSRQSIQRSINLLEESNRLVEELEQNLIREDEAWTLFYQRDIILIPIPMPDYRREIPYIPTPNWIRYNIGVDMAHTKNEVEKDWFKYGF